MFLLNLPRASSFSGDIDWLVELVTWICGIWFFATQFMFFWLMWRFRARDGVKPQYVTGKEPHLKRWINIPHFLILICDIVIIVAAVKVWVHIKQTLPPADDTVRVMSQQWAWTFQHSGLDAKLDTADDVWTSDTLHVAEGRTYHFILESRDVLHSFFIPAFRLKQDAIPGRAITGWFKPTRTGTFDVLCAEICGIGHGVMGGKVVIDSPDQHAAWVQQHSVAAGAVAATPDTTTHAAAGATN